MVNGLPPFVGKEIEFTSFSIYKGERILNITFTDGTSYYITSDSDMRFYEESEFVDE